MPTITLNVPDEYFAELKDISEGLSESPEQCLMLALDFLLQNEALDTALMGVANWKDQQSIVDFPELKEELGVDLQFHPAALADLEALDEELQIEILGQLVERLAGDDPEMENAAIDLTLKELPEGELMMSAFDFGNIVYLNGDALVIYHVDIDENFALDEDDEFEDDEDEYEDDEDEDEYEEEDEFEDEDEDDQEE